MKQSVISVESKWILVEAPITPIVNGPFIKRPQMVGYVVDVKGYLGMGRLRIYGRYLKGGTEPTAVRGWCLEDVRISR